MLCLYVYGWELDINGLISRFIHTNDTAIQYDLSFSFDYDLSSTHCIKVLEYREKYVIITRVYIDHWLIQSSKPQNITQKSVDVVNKAYVQHQKNTIIMMSGW